MKKNYSLHIAHHKGAMKPMQPEYTMMCAPAAARMSEGGAMPRAYFPSWDNLRSMLRSVHCGEDELATAKKSLDQHGAYILHEVWLEDDQLSRLGFDLPEST